jgi:hypothetical protein
MGLNLRDGPPDQPSGFVRLATAIARVWRRCTPRR